MKLVRPIEVDDAALTDTNVAETDYSAWSSGATYAAGARVILTSTHRIYESAQAGNLNHNPATDDGTWWLTVGATNRWRMFDGSSQSQTTNADSIEVEIDAAGRVDSVILLNADAAEATVTMNDALEGEVYSKTVSLVSPLGITDWYAYFFEPIERIADYAFTDLPPYANATIGVSITDEGGNPKVGELVIGLSKTLGQTAQGARVGIRDYSQKATDDFGNATVTERAFSKRATFSFLVERSFVDTLQTLLAGYRATPIVYIGDESLGSTLIYGFYKDFDIVVAYPNHALCDLEAESLA